MGGTPMAHIFEESGIEDESREGMREADDCNARKNCGVPLSGDHTCSGGTGRRRRGRGRSGNASKGDRKTARASRSSRALSLAVLAQEYIWLWDVRHGISTREIAIREGLNIQRVRIGVARAKALERDSQTDTSAIRAPRLIPLFPIGAYTPQSTCAHHRPIEHGSLLCCMVCHCSGVDDHPGLLRSPLTDPIPEPKQAAAPSCKRPKQETRKQRRQRLFGTPALATSA
jgi:hypothetical protein